MKQKPSFWTYNQCVIKNCNTINDLKKSNKIYIEKNRKRNSWISYTTIFILMWTINALYAALVSDILYGDWDLFVFPVIIPIITFEIVMTIRYFLVEFVVLDQNDIKE